MSTAKKMLVLKSSDGDTFEVEEAVAMESQAIKHIIEDGCADSEIPIHNVNSKMLALIIEFCRKHVESAATVAKGKSILLADDDCESSKSLEVWDAEFFNKLDMETLVDLILAANYLSTTTLLDLACKTVGNMIRGKDAEEVRKTFNIKNDYTPEEEEAVRKENWWAFEDSLGNGCQ